MSRQAYMVLRHAVRDRLLAADTYYSEVQVANALSISRTPVREALTELAREGIVEKVPQRGFRIRRIDESERTEVFDLRSLLESYVARRLANEATSVDIVRLRGILARQAAMGDDLPGFLDADEEFHLTLPTLLGLERTTQVLRSLRGIIWITGLAAIAKTDRMPNVLREHQEIVDEIEARSLEGATKAIQRHIAETAKAASGL